MTTMFDAQCGCRYKKAKRKRELEEAAENDPIRAEMEKKRAHEDFLAAGGYHGSSSVSNAGGADDAWLDDGAGGGGVGASKSQKGGAGDDEEVEEEEEEEQEADATDGGDAFGVSYWTEQRDREQSDDGPDVLWLRERGYLADAAEDALASAPVAAKGDDDALRARRCAALASLQSAAREGASFEPDVDAAEAAVEREEEREGLAAIFDADLKLLGGEDVGVPVTAFEPMGAEAPSLVVELYMDPVASAGYPLGGGLPFIAPVGGGLLEEELRELTEALVAHAVENIDLGPLAFELATIAEEKANDLVDDRRKLHASKAKPAKKKVVKKPAGDDSREYATAADEKAADHAHKARSASAQQLLAAVRSGKPVPVAKPAPAAGGDGGTEAAVAPAPAPAPAKKGGALFDDLFSGTDTVDKGGYKSKKKKKKK